MKYKYLLGMILFIPDFKCVFAYKKDCQFLIVDTFSEPPLDDE